MLQACILAAIAGYADTIGYLRYEAFAGLMTGNTILLGLDVAAARWSAAAFHAFIITVFLSGVMLSQVLLRLGLAVWIALAAAALFLVACSFLSAGAAASLLALAMGMQNSAANRFNGVNLNTVFITGNLQKLGEGLIARCWPSRHPGAPRAEGFAIFGLVWLSYALGAGLGALAAQLTDWPLLLPAALLPLVMLRPRSALPAGAR
jgi:uncharacterized membrane protein YoaK (UPF0700 family)